MIEDSLFLRSAAKSSRGEGMHYTLEHVKKTDQSPIRILATAAAATCARVPTPAEMYNIPANANETATGKQCAIISIFIEPARGEAEGGDKNSLAVFGLFRALCGGHCRSNGQCYDCGKLKKFPFVYCGRS